VGLENLSAAMKLVSLDVSSGPTMVLTARNATSLLNRDTDAARVARHVSNAPYRGVRFGSGGMEPSPGSVIRIAQGSEEHSMNGLIYLVGLVVVVGVILSFFGLR
jgi:hypothetical protein